MGTTKNIILYFKSEPKKNQNFWGEIYLRRLYNTLFREKKISGVDRVFINLCKSFDLIKVKYTINKPFNQIISSDIPIVIGRGRYCLEGYDKPNKIIAGIALMTHPSEWPDLCEQYPIAKYLQHSNWANNIYKKYYPAEVCDTWFSGVDTEKWQPAGKVSKKTDFLIYQKFLWDSQKKVDELLKPIILTLQKNNLSFELIKYGDYTQKEYFTKLFRSKSLLFFSEHESQGFACCEAMSMNVPVLAWDQEQSLDPNRFTWGDPEIPATSVPFFSDKCGLKFKNFAEFELQLNEFIKRLNGGDFAPREFVLNNLTLEKSGQRMIEIIKHVYPDFKA